MSSRHNLARVKRLEPRIDDLAAWLTERRGDQLAEVIRRSLDGLRDQVTAQLREDGHPDLAARIVREWPAWAARIVPEQIAAVTGSRVGDHQP